MYGVKTKACRVLVGKPEGKRAFGTLRDRGGGGENLKWIFKK
jgi:hypothetical protein